MPDSKSYFDFLNKKIKILVIDDKLWNSSTDTSKYWQGDAITLYVDCRSTEKLGLNTYEKGVAQVIIAPCLNDSLLIRASLWDGNKAIVLNSFEAKASKFDSGWCIETKLPWSQLGVTKGSVGQRLNLNLELCDSDSGYLRTGAYSRFFADIRPSRIRHFKDPSPWGHFVLSSSNAPPFPVDLCIREELHNARPFLRIEAAGHKGLEGSIVKVKNNNAPISTLQFHTSRNSLYAFCHELIPVSQYKPDGDSLSLEVSLIKPKMKKAALCAKIFVPVLKQAQIADSLLNLIGKKYKSTNNYKLAKLYAETSLDAAQDLHSFEQSLLKTARNDLELLTLALDSIADTKWAPSKDSFPCHLSFVSHIDSSYQPLRLSYPSQITSGKKYPLQIDFHGRSRANFSRRAFLCADLQSWFKNGYSRSTNKDSVIFIRSFGRGNCYFPIGQEEVDYTLDSLIAKLPIDTNRICLTGGSYGARNALLHAIRYPDRFASLGLRSGWYSPADHDTLTGENRYLSLYKGVFGSLFNVQKIPIAVLHNDGDDACPVEGARALATRLKAYGNVKYKELPLKKHGFPLDSAMEEMKWILSAMKMNSDTIRLKTITPRYANSSWLRIENVFKFGDTADITGIRDSISYTFTASNVQRFSAFIKSRSPQIKTSIIVNGKIIAAVNKTDRYAFELTKDGNFQIAKAGYSSLIKNPKQAGPIEDIQTTPLIFVYGTLDKKISPILRQVAEQEAELLIGYDVGEWGGGKINIIADTALNPTIRKSKSLVLFGGPNDNAISRMYLNKSSIKIMNKKINLARVEYSNESQRIDFIQPHPENTNRYVLYSIGNSIDAYCTGIFEFGSYDFVVREGTAIQTRGLFDNSWKIDSSLIWSKPLLND